MSDALKAFRAAQRRKLHEQQRIDERACRHDANEAAEGAECEMLLEDS